MAICRELTPGPCVGGDAALCNAPEVPLLPKLAYPCSVDVPLVSFGAEGNPGYFVLLTWTGVLVTDELEVLITGITEHGIRELVTLSDVAAPQMGSYTFTDLTYSHQFYRVSVRRLRSGFVGPWSSVIFFPYTLATLGALDFSSPSNSAYLTLM